MKSLMITILLAVLPLSAFAAENQTGEIVGQVNVTKDAIQQILAKLKQAPSEQAGSNPDFVAKAEEFNKEAADALANFEAKLPPLLSQLQFYYNRIMAVQNSKTYSEEQRRLIVESQIDSARTVAEELSAKYREAIDELYRVGFHWNKYNKNIRVYIYRDSERRERVKCGEDFPSYFKIESSDPSLNQKEVSYVRGRFKYVDKSLNNAHKCDEGSDSEIISLENTYVPELRDTIFQDQIKDGCYSSTCLALYSAHRLFFLQFVSQTIDKDIDFELPDQRGRPSYSLTLRGNNSFFLSFDDLTLDKRLKPYLTLKQGDGNGLPFEISDQEYKEILARKERVTALEKLRYEIMNPPGSLFSDWQCPTSVNEIKTALCGSMLGCLSREEAASIEQAVKDAFLYDKRTRLACINSR